jgi:NAD(P)-dependent dehydrogenase (short-subunit alcohol dehydrogenase family)
MSLSGRVALVTGGGRGIGRAIAERLAAGGARVVVTGRTVNEIDEVAARLGGVAIPMDAADRASTDAAIARIRDEVGPVDLLINNAGASESAPVERTADELWDAMIAVNATSVFRITRAFLPLMIVRGFGRIVNIASNAGLTGYAYTSAYCAAKHAVVGMTRAIAAEIGKTGVTINAVCPGWTATRMVDEAVTRIAQKTGRHAEEAASALAAMSPQKRLIEPREVAHLVFSLCQEDARGIHGQAIAIDGGQVLA